MTKTMWLPIVAAMALSGCDLDPRNYETPPVSVQTSRGLVVCQLYTPERIVWDRAIDYPANLTVKEADGICLAEGKRQKNG